MFPGKSVTVWIYTYPRHSLMFVNALGIPLSDLDYVMIPIAAFAHLNSIKTWID